MALVAACTGGGQDPGDATASASPSATTDVAAGGTDLDGADITVGSKDYDEQLVLSNISTIVLEAAGVNVIDRLDLGGTEAVRSALTGGQIDHYWEYTGIGWFMHLGKERPPPDPQEQWEQVRDGELANGVVWLTPAPFNNTYGIAFPRKAARRLGRPETLSDLGELVEDESDTATLCVEREFQSRRDGLPGMEEAYGFELPEDNVTTLDLGVVYSALSDRDPCNFGEVFTTDGRIAALDLEVLEDDLGFFPVYNATPVFTIDVYRQYGRALEDLFEPVAEALTQETMIELNKRLSSDGELPEDVARSFLTDNDLLPE
ncbi:MAG: glycine betaine ABC transporter substrate-binding protein [Actinobacteria bacterium]|nr:glycine betaine ABC transporter substrate-binding protein [Actinomycetota bacterium]